MAIVKWSPISRMLSQWPDMWDDEIFNSLAPTSGANNLDVYETEDEVVVEANVAGVSEDDIELTFDKGVLWIKADRQVEDSKDKKHYSKSEWSYSYKVAVPGMIDMGQEPEATINDGLVKVIFKKSEASKPKKLTLKRK